MVQCLVHPALFEEGDGGIDTVSELRFEENWGSEMRSGQVLTAVTVHSCANLGQDSVVQIGGWCWGLCYMTMQHGDLASKGIFHVEVGVVYFDVCTWDVDGTGGSGMGTRSFKVALFVIAMS